MAFLNMFSVAIANNTHNHSPAAKRLAPKLSRVEIDVDYSSLLLPFYPCCADSLSSTGASACSNGPYTGAEEPRFSSSADSFSLRLRGGHKFRRHPCSDACHASGEALRSSPM